MPEILGGRISYSRKVQPVRYESKGAEGELSFALTEGEDPAAALAEVGAVVRAGVLRLVGEADEPSEGESSRRRRFHRRSEPDDEIPS